MACGLLFYSLLCKELCITEILPFVTHLYHKLLKMALYSISVQDPWFSYISSGKKVVEGRLKKNKFSLMVPGDTVEITNGEKRIVCTIASVKEYASFYEYLYHEGLDRCLPSVTSIEDGVNVYYEFYSKEDENTFGIVAITLQF